LAGGKHFSLADCTTTSQSRVLFFPQRMPEMG